MIHVDVEMILSFHSLSFFSSIRWFLASKVAISGENVPVGEFLALLRLMPSVLVVRCLQLSYRRLKLQQILRISVVSWRSLNYRIVLLACSYHLFHVLLGFTQWYASCLTSISEVPTDQLERLEPPALNSVAFDCSAQPGAAATFHSGP